MVGWWQKVERLDAVTSLIERFSKVIFVLLALLAAVGYIMWAYITSLPDVVIGLIGLATLGIAIWLIVGLQRLLGRRTPLTKETLKQAIPQWLQDVVGQDTNNPQNAAFVHNVVVMWRLMDRTGAHFFDFQVQVFNGSIYDLVCGTKVEGNLRYDSDILLPTPEVTERPEQLVTPRAGKTYVQLRQDLTNLTPVIEKLRSKTGEKIAISFKELKVWAEYRDPNGELVASFPLTLPPRTPTPPVAFIS